tara:strand:- start:33 stop:488 length:456 start_codon:yes stop_codon:yes gene_type:complete
LIFKPTLLAFIFLLLANVSFAQIDEKIDNKVLEDRAQLLFKELRCMVCQNQSLSDSDAGLAVDLRSLIREKVTGGSSNLEIKNFLVERYGDYILLKPQFSAVNLVLWMAPVLFLIIIFYIALRNIPIRKAEKEKDLSKEESTKLKKILDDL